MITAHTNLERLREALEVRSYLEFERTNVAFGELIVYKDWNTGTEVRFEIVQMGNPTGARETWRTIGVTPWAWRYVPLGLDGRLPTFTFVLNRKAQLRVKAYDAKGKSIAFPPQAEYEKVNFSEFTLQLEGSGPLFRYRPRHCIPQYDIRRPQTSFLPTTDRFERMFELGSTSLLYFPRDLRTRSGEVRVEPVAGGSEADLKKQRDRRYSSTRKPRTDTSKGSEYVVVSAAKGHQIWSVDGEYGISVEIDDLHRPAEYNFTFESRAVEQYIFDGNATRTANWDELELYVHHGPNVSVTARAETRDWKLKSRFRVREESVNGYVAFLGERLPMPWKFEPLNRGGGGGQFLLFIGSLVLIFVPGGWIAGLALTVGELAYTYETGHNFFGEPVSPAEFAAMGLLGLVGAALDVQGAVRALSGATHAVTADMTDALRLAFRQFADEYDTAVRGSLKAVEQAGSDPIVKLISSLSRSEQQALAAIGSANLTPAEYLRQAAKLLSDHLELVAATRPKEHELIISSILEGLLTPDGQTLADDYLRTAYNAYRRNPRTKTEVDPLTWLGKSNAGHVQSYLASIMGENYRAVIKAALTLKTGRHIVVATESNIAKVFQFFDEVFAIGLAPYSTLDAMRSQARFDPIRGLLRNCFEFEHPVELRFARNLDGRQHFKVIDERGRVRWALDPNPEGHDVKSIFHAIVVARTPRHAALLSGRGVGSSLTESAMAYTQHPKTRITASWIPWGAEHLATPQEIADTICATLLEVNFHQLGRSPSQARLMMRSLEQDFELMTDLINGARGTHYKTPVLTHVLDDVNPAMRPGAAGWPRFSRNRRDVWRIANLKDVEDARKAREAWAEAARARAGSGNTGS